MSPELKLLVLACRAKIDPEALPELERLIDSEEINWEEVGELADFHRIRPVLFHGLQQVDHQSIPENYLRGLKTECLHIALFNLDNAREQLRIVRTLEEAGLAAVPYRGPYMAQHAYKDLGLRETTDIDLFIRLEELPRVKEALASIGYQLHEKLSPAAEKALLREGCQYKFDRKDGEEVLFHLETHWMPAYHRYRMAVRLEDVKGFLIRGEINKIPVTTFSPEMMLLQLTMHHGGIDLWRSLKFVCDIAYLIDANRNEFDWETALSEARRLGIHQLVLNGLALTHHICPLPLPAFCLAEVQRPFYQRLVDGQLQRMELSRLVNHWGATKKFLRVLSYHLLIRERLSDKLAILLLHLRQLFLPNPEEIQASGLSFPWYYILVFIKPFRLVKEHLIIPRRIPKLEEIRKPSQPE